MAHPFPEDLMTLGIEWWYNWSSTGETDPNYVPMSWCGEDPNLPLDYSGYVLLFNEPELETQCNITPQQGIDDYLALHLKYSDVKWVVGNTTFWGGWQYWLNFFWDICNANPDCVMPEYWGIHVYLSGDTSWISYVKAQLDNQHDRIGGKFWITEFAEINGNVETDKALVGLFSHISYVERWAYFTNRSVPDDPWYINGWRVDMIDSNGDLTNIGKWYAQKLNNIFLPLISK